MARLPTPGSDDGAWGDVLNEYLGVEHNATGENIIPADVATGQVERTVADTLADLYANVKRFGAVGDGVTDDTAAIKAAHDWCYNSGTQRGTVYLPPGTYLVSDTDADGVALSWRDGVGLIGAGYSSLITCATAVKILRVIGHGSGTWKKPPMRDFHVAGGDVATVGIECYVGAEQNWQNILVRNCVHSWVLDGTQNSLFQSCKAKDSGISWSILNGAGSNVLMVCGGDAAKTRHVVFDNDASWPANALLGAPLYARPTNNLLIGGIFERTMAGGTFTEIMYINNAYYNTFDGVVFALTDATSPTSVVELSTSSATTLFRNCEFYGDSHVVPGVKSACSGLTLDHCTWLAVFGDHVTVANGKLTRVLYPSGTPEAGKKVVAHGTGTANARSDVLILPERSGGTGAQLPAMGDGFIPYYFHATDLQVRHYDPGLGGVGSWVKNLEMIEGAGAPTANARHLGQTWIDTTNDDAYIAIGVGAGASDWKKITP